MPKQSTTYHREDLRGELLEAARQYVEENGHEGLSVRKIAQLVGVSPGAPYHHFPDRSALLLGVALQGYDTMNGLGEAAAQSAPPGHERVRAMCISFLRFCASHPRLFELMYESELTRPVAGAAITSAQRRGFDILRRNVLSAIGPADMDDLGIRIASLWSTIYGFALLRGRQMIQPHDEILEPMSERLEDAIVRRALTML